MDRIRRSALAGAAGLALVLAACTPADEWASTRYDAGRSGANGGETAVGTGEVGRLRQVWTRSLGAPVGDPVVAGGRVFAPAGNRFFARRADTGAALWSKTHVYEEFPGFGVTSQPGVVVGDLVVVPTRLDYLRGGETYGYDAATGTERWSGGTRGVAAPTARDGKVYIPSSFAGSSTSSSWLYVAEAATGRGVWSTPSPGGGFGSPAAVGDLVHVSARAGRDSPFLAAYDDRPCPGRNYCEPRWYVTFDAPISEPAVSGGLVLVGTASGVRAYDASTGALRWSGSGGNASASSPAVAGDVVYVGGADGKLSAFRASGCGRATCAPLWTTAAGSPIRSDPSVANGVVYVGSDDGRVRAFPAAGCGRATCTALWTGRTGGAVTTSPAVTGGRLYVGSEDGTLYAFGL